jgi:hypothetical protein
MQENATVRTQLHGQSHRHRPVHVESEGSEIHTDTLGAFKRGLPQRYFYRSNYQHSVHTHRPGSQDK